MDKIIGKKIDLKKTILGTGIIIIGLIGLLYGPAIISILSLAISGFFALWIVYGKDATLSIFSKPKSPIKITIKYFLLNIVLSFSVSLFLQYVLKWNLSGNPANEGFQLLALFVIPIMLLGEELFSIYFFSIFSSKFSVPIASVFSAIIFGLIHYSTYNNGNILHTLVHILLIQGVARLLFNQAAIKSNSILTSWGVHILFDFFALLTAYFLG